jgi:hypothetical protein
MSQSSTAAVRIVPSTAPLARGTGYVRTFPLRRQHLVAVPGTIALVLWITALPLIDTNQIGDTGLISVLPRRFLIALGLLTVGFVASIRLGLRGRWQAMHVGALVLIVHGTLPLIYDSPRFAYVYKHLGAVDLVTRYGSVDRTVDAYNNWPGFFLLNAYFRESAGLPNSLGYTPWAPVFFNLSFALVLFFAYRPLVPDAEIRWFGVWVFLLGNWVGQDYLAPQAFGFLFSIAIIGICLSWLRTAGPLRWPEWLLVGPLRRLSLRQLPSPPPSLAPPRGGQRLATALLLILFATVVASHQLTPLMIILSVTSVIVVARRRPLWLPLVMLIMVALWFRVIAGDFISAHPYLVGSVGHRPDAAVSSELSDLTTAPGQVLVARISRLLTASLWLLAVAGFVTRWRRGHRDLTLAALALSPIPLLALVTYGGEMLFRVYLFSLPWVALLAGVALTELCHWRPSRWLPSWLPPMATAVVSFLLALGLCVSAYGLEKVNHIRRGEVEASVWFYDNAPDGSLMMQAAGNFPSRLEGNYGRFEVGSLLDDPRYLNHNFVPADLPRVVRIIEADTRASMAVRKVKQANAYIVVSTSMVQYADLYRRATPAQMASLESIVASSNRFELVYSNADARIYQLGETVKP